MREHLRKRLVDVSAIGGALTSGAGVAIAWDELPRDTFLPGLAMTQVAPGREYTHDGHDGLDFAWVQFDLWTQSGGSGARRAQDALAAALIAEMETLRDVTVAGLVPVIRFHPGFVEGDRGFPPVDLEGGIRAFKRAIDIRFHWETL